MPRARKIDNEPELHEIIEGLAQLGLMRIATVVEKGVYFGYTTPVEPPPLTVFLGEHKVNVVWSQVPGETTRQKILNYVSYFLGYMGANWLDLPGFNDLCHRRLHTKGMADAQDRKLPSWASQQPQLNARPEMPRLRT